MEELQPFGLLSLSETGVNNFDKELKERKKRLAAAENKKKEKEKGGSITKPVGPKKPKARAQKPALFAEPDDVPLFAEPDDVPLFAEPDDVPLFAEPDEQQSDWGGMTPDQYPNETFEEFMERKMREWKMGGSHSTPTPKEPMPELSPRHHDSPPPQRRSERSSEFWELFHTIKAQHDAEKQRKRERVEMMLRQNQGGERQLTRAEQLAKMRMEAREARLKEREKWGPGLVDSEAEKLKKEMDDFKLPPPAANRTPFNEIRAR
jgi:hypothetical protein